MLTQLRFKNWRSLRDVTISDLTPITVFVGANSSGKSNIVEALNFLRQMVKEDAPEAVYFQAQRQKIRNLQASDQAPIEIAFSFALGDYDNLSYLLAMQPEGDKTKFVERLTDSAGNVLPTIDGRGVVQHNNGETGNTLYRGRRNQQPSLLLSNGRFPGEELPIQVAYAFVTQRWQILRENFSPGFYMAASEYTNSYLVDEFAHNIPAVLEFMQRIHPEIYAEVQNDVNILLSHVEKLETRRDERETRIVLHEKMHGGTEAPTISGGTARVLAMLTAYYALDMRSPELPGLVVIEEPDTAIHPLLLENLVDLLRSYTERQDRPRQFILTTHNPHFLDYFRPEEVRVVERDPETGETFVDTISDSVKEIWLPKHSLGDAWTSRVIGGIPTE